MKKGNNCIYLQKGESKTFEKYQNKYNVSKTDLITALYSYFTKENKEERDDISSERVQAFLDNYFKIGEAYYYDKKIYEKLNSFYNSDKLTNGSISYSNKIQARRVYERSKELFGEYNVVMYQSKDENRYVIKIAKPKYSKPLSQEELGEVFGFSKKEKKTRKEVQDIEGATEFNKLPAYTGSTMTYAGIGSRETPKKVKDRMTEVAKKLETLGYTLNTGTVPWNDDGADQAFARGTNKKNTFSPDDANTRTKKIAKEVHPNPSALTGTGLKLMARNTYQVFGKNLDTPVDFVLYYAKPSDNPIRPQGGTGQAVEMANRKGIPTINMMDDNWEEQLEEVLADSNEAIKSSSRPKKSGLERAQSVIDRIVEKSKRVYFDPAKHIYRIYNSEEEKLADVRHTKGTIAKSVSSVLNEGSNVDYKLWGTPSTTLGNTVDQITRDFFSSNKKDLKKSYPNLTEEQLKDLISDLKLLRKYFDSRFGKNKYKIITEEFPIFAQTSEGKYIAGTMDMVIIDDKGNIHILDMKNKRSGVGSKDFIRYGNQTSIYSSIVSSDISPEDEVNMGDRVIINFKSGYPAPMVMDEGEWIKNEEVNYAVTGNEKLRQLTINGENIQDNEEYEAPRLVTSEEDEMPISFGDKTEGYYYSDSLIDVGSVNYAIEFKNMSEEEQKGIQDELGTPKEKKEVKVPEVSTSIRFKRSDNTNNFYNNPLLTASERTFLSNQIMLETSFIITQLQNGIGADIYLAGRQNEGKNFKGMSREDILATPKLINDIFNYLKDTYFNPIKRTDLMLNPNYNLMRSKLQLAYDNFGILLDGGYAKLISLEGVTVVEAKPEDITLNTGDNNLLEENDSGNIEEKEREYWQLGQRQISAKSSLSNDIRRMFERLHVITKDGINIKDEYGYNFDTFVDPNIAINNIFEWVRNVTTIEEMEKILQDKAEFHPYLNTILDAIKEEPIRSQFFQNFRKDFTQYSIITVTTLEDGSKSYETTIINTKGALKTIMDNLTARYNLGIMSNIIKTSDTITGKGKVNIEEVKNLKDSLDSLYKDWITAFTDKNSKPKGFRRIHKNTIKELTTILNKLGIDVFENVLYETAAKDSERKNISGTTVNFIVNELNYLFSTLRKNADRNNYNPISKEENNENNIYGNLKNIVEKLAPNIEESIESSSYENGKMHYSFVTPSYLGRLTLELSDAAKNSKKFDSFIKNNYSSYRWFAETDNKGNVLSWNNVWLELLQQDKYRKGFEHKVQLSFDKVGYRELSELGYSLSLLNEYFYLQGTKDPNWAWYRVPILSNKPSSEFIKFKRYTGKGYQEEIRKGFKKVFNQEILRMKTVLERAINSDINKIGVKDKVTYDIKDKVLTNKIKKAIRTKSLTLDMIVKDGKSIFENSGAEFKFLDALNNEITNKTEIGKLIIDKLNGKKINESRLDSLLMGTNTVIGSKKTHKPGAFDKMMQEIVEKEIANWKEIGALETEEYSVTNKKTGKKEKKYRYKYLKKLGSTEEEVISNLTEYVWNDMFATINIIELTATDLAYYKNMEDFQKRYAQVHSPALRLNTTALDSKGNRVSDGIARTIYLKDIISKSEIVNNVKVIFDRKLATVTNPAEKAYMSSMFKKILKDFNEINVADAEGYSSPTSYRKKMTMAGRWDDEMEKAYNRIKSGNYNINDLNIIWQPLKPFVYTQISKSSGASTMSKIKVPVQNKNSEYLLLLADAIMRGGNQVNKLSSIFDFMEDSSYDGRISEDGKVIKEGVYNRHGIDTVQFESAVNSGSMGSIDISDVNKCRKEIMEDEDLVEEIENTYGKDIKKLSDSTIIKEYLKYKAYYNIDHSSSSMNDNGIYNDQFVHEFSFEDYGIQQEVPAHLLDHEQLIGSQDRILSISDISDSNKLRFRVHNFSEPFTKKELIDKYQELNAKNIRESFDKLAKDLKLNSKNRKERNEALSEILKEAIRKDQRYGADLLRACSLDDNKEFIIPPCDSIQSMRIQQLLNSIIKSRINKQKIKGGPVVQASVFGMSDDLNILFEDKDRNPLKTRKDFDSDSAFKEYLDENQASLKGMEVYITCPSSDLEEAMTKPNGELMSIKEAKVAGILTDEMLKAIGYRIPTEDKYSMMPMLIKGFLPRSAGEVVMMPKEVTLLTGSDFDVDKMYIMLKVFNVKRKDNAMQMRKEAIKSYKEYVDSFNAKQTDKSKKITAKQKKEKINNLEIVFDQLIASYANPNDTRVKINEQNSEEVWLKEYFNKNYKSSIVGFEEVNNEDTRDGRNNTIFDIQWSVLTNEDTLVKMFNPGSFDVQKRSAKIINILKSSRTSGKKYTYKQLSNMTKEELDEASELSVKRNIVVPSTQVYFHKQNMTAGKLIGIFANNNTSHAFLSMQRIHFNISKEASFTLNGIHVGARAKGEVGENTLIDNQTGFDGTLISKNIAGFLAASVDAVKDPVLNFMNLNTFTSGPAMVLARLGFDSDTIGLLLSQPVIEKVSREYFKRNNEGYVTIEDIINEELDDNYDDYKTIKSNLDSFDLTKETLAKEIVSSTKEKQAVALYLFKNLNKMAQNLNTLTFITKFNSVSNAVGPSIADTLVMREKYNKFIDQMEDEENAPFSKNAINILSNNKILEAFFETTIGDTGAALKIFKDYFPHYSTTFNRVLSNIRRTSKASLDAKTINKLINDFVLFKLTMTLSGKNGSTIEPLFNMNSKNRNKFINHFVSRYEEKVEELNLYDNPLIKIINVKPANSKCKVSTLEAKTSGSDIDTQEKIKNGWSDLLSNEETFNFGVELFLYNLYRNGFSYSPKTFLHLASVDTKLKLGNYIDIIRNPEFYDNDVDIESFIFQFRRNHSDNNRIVPELKESKKIKVIYSALKTSGKQQITIKTDSKRKGLNSILTTEDKNHFAPMIKYKDKLYYLEGEDEQVTNEIVYTEITPLGNTNNFLEYNASENAYEMQSVLRSKEEYEKEEDTPEIVKDDIPESNNYNKGNGPTKKDKARLVKMLDLDEDSEEIVDSALDSILNDAMEGKLKEKYPVIDMLKSFVSKHVKEYNKVEDKLYELINKFCR